MVRFEPWRSAAVAALLTAAASADDPGLARAIVGTWVGEYRHSVADDPRHWVEASTLDRYGADGQVTGSSHYRYPDREESFRYRGRWWVEDGQLVIEVLEARGGYVKAGSVSRDRIVSVSDSELTLEAADGNRIVLQRRPEPG